MTTDHDEQRPEVADHPAPWPLLATMRAEPLQVTTVGCQALNDSEYPQALGISYWFTPPDTGRPYRLTIRFVGRRLDLQGWPGPGDRFSTEVTVDPVLPGSGPVAVTTRIQGINPGHWRVHASEPGPVQHQIAPRGETATGQTRFAPVVNVRAPGARLGVWPALVGLGAAAGLTLSGLMAHAVGLRPWSVVMTLGVAACLGLLGAKIYFRVTHPRQSVGRWAPRGMSIQGFVLVSAAATVVGARVQGMPIGTVLDLMTPGLFLAMAIGRLGCILAECCAGRPACSRWGIWSSDRTLGVRRIPVQLFESALAGALALAGFVADWIWLPRLAGLIFVAAVGAYIAIRQALFVLRADPHTSLGRHITAAAGVVAITAAVTASVLVCPTGGFASASSPPSRVCASATTWSHTAHG